jgi:hypothetical protein
MATQTRTAPSRSSPRRQKQTSPTIGDAAGVFMLTDWLKRWVLGKLLRIIINC